MKGMHKYTFKADLQCLCFSCHSLGTALAAEANPPTCSATANVNAAKTDLFTCGLILCPRLGHSLYKQGKGFKRIHIWWRGICDLWGNQVSFSTATSAEVTHASLLALRQEIQSSHFSLSCHCRLGLVSSSFQGASVKKRKHQMSLWCWRQTVRNTGKRKE